MIQCTFEDGKVADGISLRHVVVDALVLKGDRILLVKRTGKLLEGGKWALVGGFVSRNETAAQAIAREVLEETGWQVKGITLFRLNDNPGRPNEADRQNVSLTYICTATKKTGEADWESDDQQWFGWDELPDRQNLAFDHIDSIDLYRKYMKKKFALPMLR